jgi:hypothetical protein
MTPFIVADDGYGSEWVWDNTDPKYPNPLVRRGYACPDELRTLITQAVEGSG